MIKVFELQTDRRLEENSNHGKTISNGNWTEWSPIRSVIIQVITKSDLFKKIFPITNCYTVSMVIETKVIIG